MIVYIVQKLDWKWKNEAFVLRDAPPVKAFASCRDAEKLCEELEWAAPHSSHFARGLERVAGANG